MRILQVVNLGFEAGGAEKSVRLIADGLRSRGHQVTVLATDRLAQGQQVFADRLVPGITGGPLRRLTGYFWHRSAYRETRAVLREFRPDLVHLHTIGEFSPAVLAATRGHRRLLTVHGPEDWTGQLLRWNLRSAADGGRLSAGDTARLLYLRLLQRPWYLPWVRRIDRVLAPSGYFAEAVRRDTCRVPVAVLPNGIERTAARQPLRGTGELLFVGRTEPVKGVRILIDAFRLLLARHPGARLTVVGEGSELATLRSAAADLADSGRLVFRGWLTQPEVAECLAAASVVVLPSLWPENFPTVALEALQVGRPLVASRVGGLPELVGPDNGVLVPAGDPDALAEALGGLIGDRERLERLGAGSALRSDRYGVAEFLDALERHYQEVAAA